MKREPEMYTVRKRIKFEGVPYTAGDTIPAADVSRMRNAEMLLSAKYLVPVQPPEEEAPAPVKRTRRAKSSEGTSG